MPSAKVEIKVQVVSVLTAKVKADLVLKDSLDVVAYIPGRGQINKHSAFQAMDEAGNESNISGYSHQLLTNRVRLTISEFGHFVSAITGAIDVRTSKPNRCISNQYL